MKIFGKDFGSRGKQTEVGKTPPLMRQREEKRVKDAEKEYPEREEGAV